MFGMFKQKATSRSDPNRPAVTIDSIVNDFLHFCVITVAHRNGQFWDEFHQSLQKFVPSAAADFTVAIQNFGKYPQLPIFIAFCALEACAIKNIYSANLAETIYDKLSEHLVSSFGTETANEVFRNISFIHHCAEKMIGLPSSAVTSLLLVHLAAEGFFPKADADKLASDFFFPKSISDLFTRLVSQSDSQPFAYWQRIKPLAETASQFS